jgi:hypothetical protein
MDPNASEFLEVYENLADCYYADHASVTDGTHNCLVKTQEVLYKRLQEVFG